MINRFVQYVLNNKKHIIYSTIHTGFWFFLGAVIGIFFFTSFVYIYYKHAYAEKVYPGVRVSGIDFGGKTEEEVASYYQKKNDSIAETLLLFEAEDMVASISAKDLELGFDEKMIAEQAVSVGKGENIFSNLSLIFIAYTKGIYLVPAYQYNEETLRAHLKPMSEEIDVDPVDAKFAFENGRVSEFQTATNGIRVDVESVKKQFPEKILTILLKKPPKHHSIAVPVIAVEPEITNEEVNDLGIKERIGIGTSSFAGSIPNRVYNLTLAASRINGILVKPGEVFSFNKAIGDISTLSGYKQAYVIQNGRTVLGDGGGVCQVSTTFFRAILNAGLPVTERNPHAYRVSYYEQDSPPGIDAAIYTPTVDLKFKNDTGNHILIQAYVDQANAKMTFELYGTHDGRIATVSEPVIVSQTPAPEPLYQDDPELPKDQIKQIDWAAPGAVVYFTYEVTKDGKTLISEKYTSRYRPWQAVYLKGTKEG